MKKRDTGLEGIIEYFGKVKNEFEGEFELESIAEKIAAIPTLIDAVKKLVFPEILEDYLEYFDFIVGFFDSCKNETFLKENIQDVYDSVNLLASGLEEIKERIEGLQGFCPCCGKEVYYSAKDGQCKNCTSSRRDRLVSLFLKKISLSTATEETSVLQIAPTPVIDAYINLWCPLIKYESLNAFQTDLTFKEDTEKLKQKEDKSYDLIILSKLAIDKLSEGGFLENLKRILKDDGEIVILAELGDLEDSDNPEISSISEKIIASLNANFYLTELGIEYFGQEDFEKSGLACSSLLTVLTKTKLEDFYKGFRPVINKDLIENGPLVSVIMPAYNHEKYVRRAIESVINQSYKNIEFIVCDDASTDKTPEIMKEYSKYYKKEFYFTENLRGRIPFLAKEASGKYIALMHSDDVWDKDKLAIQIDYLEKNGGISLTWAYYLRDDGETTGDAVFFEKNRSRTQWLKYLWENSNCFCNPSSVMKREIFLEEQKHGLACRQLPDFFKWVDYLCKYDLHLICLPLTYLGVHYTGDNKNESAPTDDNIYRTSVEEGFVWMQVLEDMEDTLFAAAFKDLFRRKEATSREELICERYFLLLDSNKTARQTSAIFYMHRHYSEIIDCLKEKYNYIKADFMQDELKKGFMQFLDKKDTIVKK